MDSEVQSLEVSYFIQLTEDEGRVRGAVASLLGGGELPEERREAEGHFGNKIVWILHHVTGQEASAALKEMVSRIDLDERKRILGDLGAALDEHNALYLRISKQVLVSEGRAVLTSSDPIRVKVKPRSYVVKGDPVRLFSRLLGVSA